MRPPNVDLNIGELVLRGLPTVDRHRIGPVVEAELARLFAEHGVPQSLSGGGEVARLDGGRFRVPAGARSEVVGARIAQAVYRGLSK